MKRNRLAIVVTSVVLGVTCLSLIGVIAFVHGDGAGEPRSVTPADFVAVQQETETVEPAQAKKPAKEDEDPPKADTPDAEKAEPKEKLARAKTKTRTNPSKRPARRAPDYRPAVLQVVTNFDQADVKVNGIAYPEYYEPGEPEGMVLPAGGPYEIEVTYGENTKSYRLHLRPDETRLLLVELSGYNSGPRAPKRRVAKKERKKEEKKKKDNNDQDKPGKITVYSKPSGVVIVDGKNTSEKTPGSVELENGRHEVQVEYETGSVSEKKIVRVRTGSRIKLFFRERKK